MGGCGGSEIAHLGGSLAACTEELLGRICRGGTHRSGLTCLDLLGPGGCEYCEVVFQAESVVDRLLGDNQWVLHTSRADRQWVR